MTSRINAGTAATVAVLICTALSAVLFALRLTSAMSLTEPVQAATSGYEAESLIAIWNFINDRPVYVSRFDFPYRWAIYNWLYYVSYGFSVDAVLSALGLTDSWIPTIVRCVTLFGVATVFAAAFAAFRLALVPVTWREVWLIAGVAGFVAIGPLLGFWAMTTRPDVWALAFQALTVCCFILFLEKERRGWLILVIITAYLSWSLKQSSVTSIVAVIAFLALHRRWRPAFHTAAVFSLLCGATLVLGGEVYRSSVTLSEYQAIYSLDRALTVFVNAAAKTLPQIAMIGAAGTFLILTARRRRTLYQSVCALDDVTRFALVGAGIAAAVVVLTSTHTGAAENYYFSSLLYLSLLSLLIYRRLFDRSRLVRAAMFIGWGLQSLAVIAVLSGSQGTFSVYDEHEQATRYQRCIGTPKGPVYVADSYYALPWITPNAAQTILAFGYFADRARGVEYQHGGIGGLIDAGYFETLLLPASIEGAYDGSTLSRYRPTDTICEKLLMYMKPPRTIPE
ncbi:MAG: glycosyltransferase family 39 protein [Rhodospirillales bacterium]